MTARWKRIFNREIQRIECETEKGDLRRQRLPLQPFESYRCRVLGIQLGEGGREITRARGKVFGSDNIDRSSPKNTARRNYPIYCFRVRGLAGASGGELTSDANFSSTGCVTICSRKPLSSAWVVAAAVTDSICLSRVVRWASTAL
jgi:hypothetical protein